MKKDIKIGNEHIYLLTDQGDIKFKEETKLESPTVDELKKLILASYRGNQIKIKNIKSVYNINDKLIYIKFKAGRMVMTSKILAFKIDDLIRIRDGKDYTIIPH